MCKKALPCPERFFYWRPPVHARLIEKGMVYNPSHEDTAFTADFGGTSMTPPHKEKALISQGFSYDTGRCRIMCWWRCRDLNPGHYGYEPYALTC